MIFKIWTEMNDTNEHPVISIFIEHNGNIRNCAFELPYTFSREKIIETLKIGVSQLCLQTLPETSVKESLEFEIERIKSKLKSAEEIYEKL